MNIKAIYINEQGVIFGSDQMPPNASDYAENFQDGSGTGRYDNKSYNESLTLWKSQAIRFENQKEAGEVFRKAFFESNSASSIVFQPDSILPLSNPIECNLVGENIARPPHTAYINQMLSIKSQWTKQDFEEFEKTPEGT